MNAITAASKPTKLDQLRIDILPPEREPEFFRSLPAHVKPERFMRNLDIALMQNQKLMALDPRLIFREVSKAAALGLYLDPQLGEAYLIEAWNGKAKRAEPQLRIGYRGLIKLGRQSGEISQIYAHEVHANDAFKASLGDDKKLIHEPDIFGDRGPIVGYYAVVKYKDGDSDFEPLTIAQAHAIRDRSDGWKAFKEGKIKSTPWSTDEVEMAKKTAIRRLTKRIPQSPELAEAIRIEDAAEHSEVAAIAAPAPTPPRPPAPPPPPQPQIGHAVDDDIIDIDQDEVGEDSGEQSAEAGEESREQTAEAVDPATGEVTNADDFPGDRPAPPRTAGPYDDLDETAYFDKLEEELAMADDEATVEEIWTLFDPMARFEGKDDKQAVAMSFKRKRLSAIAKRDAKAAK